MGKLTIQNVYRLMRKTEHRETLEPKTYQKCICRTAQPRTVASFILHVELFIMTVTVLHDYCCIIHEFFKLIMLSVYTVVELRLG